LAAGTGEAGQRAQRSIDLRSLQDRRDDTAHATDDCHEQRDKQVGHLVEPCIDAEEALVHGGESLIDQRKPLVDQGESLVNGREAQLEVIEAAIELLLEALKPPVHPFLEACNGGAKLVQLPAMFIDHGFNHENSFGQLSHDSLSAGARQPDASDCGE
jgi:hypothetical protein